MNRISLLKMISNLLEKVFFIINLQEILISSQNHIYDQIRFDIKRAIYDEKS